MVEQEVERRWHNHPAERRCDGQYCSLKRSQLTDQYLPLNLQSDQEKEQSHKPIVDPEMQRIGQQPADATESQVHVPEMKVVAGKRRVCPDERRHRATNQEDSTGCFQVCELLERPNESLYRCDSLVRPRFVHYVMIRLLALTGDESVAF